MPGEITKADRLLAERLKRCTCGHLPDDEGAMCSRCNDKKDCDFQWEDVAQIIADDRNEERRVHEAVVAALKALFLEMKEMGCREK